MKIELIYIYNLLLMMLYAITMAFSVSFFIREKNKKKKTLYLVTSLYLLFFILDNSVISMTEIISSFASNYNSSFQGTSFIKTTVFLVNNFCQLWIVHYLSKRKMPWWEYLILLAIFLFMLLPSLPSLPNTATKVYLYYLPNQLLLFYTGLIAFFNSKKENVSKLGKKYLKLITLLAMIASVAILIEDTFVIFTVDQYSIFNTKIMNRNVSEDLFSIIACWLLLYYFLKDYPLLEKRNQALQTKALSKDAIQDFFDYYHLTEREQDICQLLLEHKQNQEIAKELYLSVGTVKTHIHNIYIKMAINKREQFFSLYKDYFAEHP
ncbi:helix-turn-helix transcriptional regulator [Streptococcus mutans]|uniref:helix-turn-helix transcriptional regulator n=1 Tax=Streptococcus mutans TaxID=1309 RepID=UPI0002B52B27|nr:LuxR C-terminal-related transcriptional regulator [Streptococcus mutans]EMC05775.1 putative transcriptional regulator [Streptococcus mutans NLML5]EMC19794.1 putative transcriptional regulator [Streptococcus mutans NV1996]NLQ32558.1 helix-turn-helix transcriptional regulator [Streptococcus mutans]QFG44321.1 bacterial regulatory, luxR family protein [Streptococcus mutans]